MLIDDLRSAARDEWTAFTRHPFVLALADGTLPPAAFRAYLVQDYRFLVHFARAHAPPRTERSASGNCRLNEKRWAIASSIPRDSKPCCS